MGKCQWPGRWQYKREYWKSQFSWNKSSKEECWSGNCWMYMPNITQCGREGFWRICCSFNVWFGKPLCWRFPLVWKPYKTQIYFEEILQLLGSRLSRSHYVYFQSLAMYWRRVNQELKKYPGLRCHTSSQKVNVFRDFCAYMKLFRTLCRNFTCTSTSLFYQLLPMSINFYKLRNRWYNLVWPDSKNYE